MFTVFMCPFCHSKSMKRERRKANSYCDREQTRDCIGGGGIPRLTTLCENRGSSSLLLQWFHLLLVCLLFLCKPRKPICVILKLNTNVYTYDDSPGFLKVYNLFNVRVQLCVKERCIRRSFKSGFKRNL